MKNLRVLTFALVAAASTWGGAAVSQNSPSAPASKASFKNGASTTGWLDFNFYADRRVYVPAQINGQDVLVWLVDGAKTSSIDNGFAASLGLPRNATDTPAATVSVQIQIGDLTLQNVQASPIDLGAKRTDPVFVPFVLGDDLFNEVAVDIDFAQHRIAFTNPASITKLAGAIEVPIIQTLGARTVPVSVEGALPTQFKFYIGDPSPMTVYQTYYEAHKLLENRPTSLRLGGGLSGARPQEAVATLRRAQFAGVDFSQVPGVFPPDTVRADETDKASGHIGLALLSRFRLIIDYSHDRLYAAPYTDKLTTTFAKDRLGLTYSAKGSTLIVDLVSPGSPAQAAGLKVGDTITRVDQLVDEKPVQVWPPSGSAPPASDIGTIMAFTLEDGAIRKVKLAYYF